MKESRTFHAHNDDDGLVFNLQLINIYPVRFTTDTAREDENYGVISQLGAEGGELESDH